MTRLKIIFAGSGEFGLPTLRHLVESQQSQIIQAVTQPDRPAGRGRKLSTTAIAQFAVERDIPLIRTSNINELQLPAADLLIVIAFGQKIAPHVVDHPRLGSINLHASRLPRYRGAAPVNRAIINGDAVTGNSVIRLAPKMDAGAILAQSELAIGPLETAGELHDRLAEDGVKLVARVVDELARGIAIETAQDDAQASLAAKLKREDARIDWRRAASAIACQIRGMYPWPGCRAALLDDTREIARATLVRARPTPADLPVAAPGTILESRHVLAGQGAVEIVEIQPQGGTVMQLDAYRNGHRWSAGMRLESIT